MDGTRLYCRMLLMFKSIVDQHNSPVELMQTQQSALLALSSLPLILWRNHLFVSPKKAASSKWVDKGAECHILVDECDDSVCEVVSRHLEAGKWLPPLVVLWSATVGCGRLLQSGAHWQRLSFPPAGTLIMPSVLPPVTERMLCWVWTQMTEYFLFICFFQVCFYCMIKSFVYLHCEASPCQFCQILSALFVLNQGTNLW